MVRLGAEPPEAVAQALAAGGVDPARAANAAAWSGGVAGLARALATDEHAAFRLDAAACLETALFGGSPFAAAAALLRAPAVAPRPKQRQDVAGALLLLDVWQSLLRDALLLQTAAPARRTRSRKSSPRAWPQPLQRRGFRV